MAAPHALMLPLPNPPLALALALALALRLLPLPSLPPCSPLWLLQRRWWALQ